MTKVIVPEAVFFLPPSTKIRYPFEIANNTRSVIHITTTAITALIERSFIDMFTTVTNSNSDIKTKIVAPGLGGSINELRESLLTRCFFEV